MVCSSASSVLAMQFLEKLNYEDDTLEERIKLAGKVFNASNLPFSRKEELIFTWIIESINSENQTKGKKKILNFLKECLGSPRIQLDGVEVKPSVCESIFKVLQTWGFHSASCSVNIAQTCVLFIIKSQIFYLYFKKNVAIFSKLAVVYFNSVTQTTCVEDCVFIVQFIVNLFSNTLLKRDLQKYYADEILLSIVNALVTLDEVSDSELERETYNSINKILFNDQGAASSYVKGLRDLDSVKETPEVYVLLQKLLKLPKKNSLESVKYLYPKFLQAFASNTKDENLRFELLVSLCGVIGFRPCEECIGCSIKTIKNFKGISVLLKMLQVVNELNFSVDAEINEVFLSTWLISLLHSFETQAELTLDMLKVIREVILLLDPIVAEQMLPYFVERVMLKKKSDLLLNVYCDTLIDIFNIFVKMSRTQFFLSKILNEAFTLLKNPSSIQKDESLMLEDIFPKKFCKKLSDSINTQPTASCFLVLSILQHHLKKHALVNLFDQDGGPVMVEVVFELTTQILQGAWVAEHTVSPAVKEQFTFILNDFSEVLHSFGMALIDKPFNSQVTTAYFNLCGAWGALNLMMIHYSYDERNLIEEQENRDASNLAYVLKFLPDITWDILVKMTVRAGDTTAKHSLFYLMEQKMSALREFEEGSEGPASLTARFLLENADDDWISQHANSLLPFLGSQEMLSLARTLSRHKHHHKIIALFQTNEFLESNDMVTAMGLMLISEIAKKCTNMGRSLVKKVFGKLLCDTVLVNEANHVVSEEVKQNLCNVAVILCDGIQEKDYETDFEISPFVQSKLELLSYLPLSYLQDQTQAVFLLVLFAVAKCLPYHIIVYDTITGILDKQHPLELPETVCWPALLQWVGTSSKDYPHRIVLLQFLLKSAFRHVSSIGDLIHSLSMNKSETNLILCTIIATNFEKIIKKKRDIQGETKASLQQSCHRDLYSCIKTVAQMKPSLHWLPVYHMSLHYHLNPKNVELDVNAQEKILKLLPDYINVIMNNVQTMNDNCDDEDLQVENNTSRYSEVVGDFLMLIMQNRSKFEYAFPEDLVTISWTALAGHLPIQKLQIYLMTASNDEFKNTLQNLTQMTTQLLKDYSLERKVCLLWNVLIMAQLGCEKSILRNNAVDHLSNIFLQLAFQWRETKNILNVHGLLVNLITSLKVRMTIQHLEMCLEVVSAMPVDASPKLIKKSLDILSTMLRYRSALMADLIPQFLQQLTFIVSIISAASHLTKIEHPIPKLADCAFAVEKLANVMVKNEKDFARVSHFAVSAILNMFEQYTIVSSVKIHLQNVAFSLLTICDTHSIAYQMRVLPPASKEIFKRIHSDYCKHHKFTGKV